MVQYAIRLDGSYIKKLSKQQCKIDFHIRKEIPLIENKNEV